MSFAACCKEAKKHVFVSHSLPAFLPMYLNMNTYARKHTNTFNARERERGGRSAKLYCLRFPG